MDCGNTLAEQIRSIVTMRDGRISPKSAHVLATKHSDLLNLLITSTSFLGTHASIAERLFCLEHSIQHHPTCVSCGVAVKFQQNKRQYSEYCSVRCATSSSRTVEKRKSTNVKRYGAAVPANTLESTQLTMMQKYGVNKPLQHPSFAQKRKETLKERYGADDTNLIPSVNLKRKQTCVERYGVEHGSRRFIVDAVKFLDDPEWLKQQHVDNKKSCIAIANELGVGVTTVTNAINRFDLLQTSNRSSYEHELCAFLDEHDITYTCNDRKVLYPKELDVYCQQHGVAIEICGHFWHSELNGKDKTYHLNKLIACNNKQLRLIQIFEQEWVEKKEIVKNRLLHIFNKNSSRLYARKCKVQQISSAEAKPFINSTHIQGFVSGSVYLGLFFEGCLVGCMSFGKARFSANQWELLRLCFSTNVVGGASKLFQFFVNTYSPTNVISYSDKRWNTGGVYRNLGFEHRGSSKPGYWYFHSNRCLKLFSRISFQKHKLENLISDFRPELTEWENMKNNNYDRIWDCGNDVWVWSSTNV